MRYVVYCPSYNFAEKNKRNLSAEEIAMLKKALSGINFRDRLHAAPVMHAGVFTEPLDGGGSNAKNTQDNQGQGTAKSR